MQAEKLSDDLASLRISRPSPEKRKRLPWIGSLLLIPIGVGSYALARPHLEAALFKAEVQLTEVLSLSPATVSSALTASGYVVPQVLAKVGSKSEGRIAEVRVREGQRVRTGDVLILLDDAEQKSALRAGAARLLSKEAELARRKAELADLERKVKRERVLAEAGVTGRAALEDLTGELEVLAESVRAARSDRDAASAEVEALRASLAELTIRAPIDGVVLTKPPQPGEVVSPSSAPFLEIADFASLVVEAEVPESRLSKIREGGPCEIMLEADPSRRHRGVVGEISPLVNRARATVVVKVRFAEEATGALPNMSARAFFLENEESAAQIGQPPKTVVPSAALVERGGAKVVFVVDGDRVRMTEVEVGAPFGPGFELVRGPRAGARLVKNPPETLLDGHRIEESKDD